MMAQQQTKSALPMMTRVQEVGWGHTIVVECGKRALVVHPTMRSVWDVTPPRVEGAIGYRVEQASPLAPNQWCLWIGGWRLDINNGEDVMINVANEATDGEHAGWCACAFDPNNGVGLGASLVLHGTETE